MHIKLDLKIFIFLILFFITSQIEIYCILIIFAILHELGHLIAGLVLKLKPKKLELNSFGLSITFEAFGENLSTKTAQKKIVIALAGPFVNLFCMLLSYILPIGEIKETIIYSNLILFLFNILPIYPLDGGRVLKEIVHMKFDYFETCSIINKISNVMTVFLIILSSVLIFYFENIAMVFIILYLLVLVAKENKKFYLIKRTYAVLKTKKLILEKI